MISKSKKYTNLFSKYISQVVLFLSLLFCFLGNVSLLNKINHFSSENSHVNNNHFSETQIDQEKTLPFQLVFIEIEKELEEEDDDDDKDELFEINSANYYAKTRSVSNTGLNTLNRTNSSKVPLYLLFHCWKDVII